MRSWSDRAGMVSLRFGWSPGLTLDVRHTHSVVERGPRGPLRAASRRRWRWTVEDTGARLQVRVSGLEEGPDTDERANRAVQPWLDRLSVHPPQPIVDVHGKLVGLLEPERAAEAAGLDHEVLRGLPPDARHLLASMASARGQAALAETTWSALVSTWVDVGELAAGAPDTATVRGPLPVTGGTVDFLLERWLEHADEDDGSVILRQRAEPEVSQVMAALESRGGVLDGLTVVSEITLHTSPKTLVPRSLELRRHMDARLPTGTSHRTAESRTWHFQAR